MSHRNCFHCQTCLTPHFQSEGGERPAVCPYCSGTDIVRVEHDQRPLPPPAPQSMAQCLNSKRARLDQLLQSLRVAA